MKRFIFLLTILLFLQTLQAQNRKLISVRAGTLSIYNSGLGVQLSYSTEIKERFFFSTSIGYFSFDEKTNLRLTNLSYQAADRSIMEVYPFTFGAKYFFSKERFNPYLSFFWGITKRNLVVHSIVNPGEFLMQSIKSVNDTQVYTSLGFEFGTLYYLTDDLAADINVNVGYGTIQTIMLVGGFTYVL